MNRFNKREMDEKLKLIIKFVKVPEEKQERTEYATREKTDNES